MGKRFGTWKQTTLALAVAFGILTVTAASESFAKSCQNDRVDLRGDWGQVSFDVALAQTPESRALGLMHVDHMPKRSGMLFIYPDESPVAFWMKNTLIPLDMLFFDASGRMTGIHENAQPHDLTSKVGGKTVKYVLEINGGLARVYGIKGETVLRHPDIGNFGKWPCE